MPESRTFVTIRAFHARERYHSRMSIQANAEPQREVYSSTEAAAIIGCDRSTVVWWIKKGQLRAWQTKDGKWMLDADALAVAKDRIHPMPDAVRSCKTCPRVAELLLGWSTGTVAELTSIMEIHPGNMRKHLNDLAKKGFAVRRLDGTWELTAAGIAWIKPQGDEPLLSPTDFANELDREVSTGT